MKELTFAAFKAWLLEQPTGTRFKTRTALACPLATYINEDHAVFGTFIAPDWKEAHESGKAPHEAPIETRIPLPLWAQVFVQEVDNIPVLYGWDFLVPREQVLAILEGIGEHPDLESNPL